MWGFFDPRDLAGRRVADPPPTPTHSGDHPPPNLSWLVPSFSPAAHRRDGASSAPLPPSYRRSQRFVSTISQVRDIIGVSRSRGLTGPPSHDVTLCRDIAQLRARDTLISRNHAGICTSRVITRTCEPPAASGAATPARHAACRIVHRRPDYTARPGPPRAPPVERARLAWYTNPRRGS